MNALTAVHDTAVQMIDTSIVRVHQHGACIADNREQLMGRSCGGLTSKIHAVVDTKGLPVCLGLTTGEAHDNRLALTLLSRLKSGAMLLADRGYDADWIRTLANQYGEWANITPKRNRKEPICFSPHLYTAHLGVDQDWALNTVEVGRPRDAVGIKRSSPNGTPLVGKSSNCEKGEMETCQAQNH